MFRKRFNLKPFRVLWFAPLDIEKTPMGMRECFSIRSTIPSGSGYTLTTGVFISVEKQWQNPDAVLYKVYIFKVLAALCMNRSMMYCNVLYSWPSVVWAASCPMTYGFPDIPTFMSQAVFHFKSNLWEFRTSLCLDNTVFSQSKKHLNGLSLVGWMCSF